MLLELLSRLIKEPSPQEAATIIYKLEAGPLKVAHYKKKTIHYYIPVIYQDPLEDYAYTTQYIPINRRFLDLCNKFHCFVGKSPEN